MARPSVQHGGGAGLGDQALGALMHTLDALDWVADTLTRTPARVDDVRRVSGCAAEEARDKLLEGMPRKL